MPISEDHTAIHSIYCLLTNRTLPLEMPHHFMWNAWKAKGYTEDDLRLVVGHVKSLITAKRRYPESLRLYNLIGDRFSEDLAEARAMSRVPKVDKGKSSVLRAIHKPYEPQQARAKSAEAVMRGNEELRKLLDLRDSL